MYGSIYRDFTASRALPSHQAIRNSTRTRDLSLASYCVTRKSSLNRAALFQEWIICIFHGNHATSNSSGSGYWQSRPEPYILQAFRQKQRKPQKFHTKNLACKPILKRLGLVQDYQIFIEYVPPTTTSLYSVILEGCKLEPASRNVFTSWGILHYFSKSKYFYSIVLITGQIQ